MFGKPGRPLDLKALEGKLQILSSEKQCASNGIKYSEKVAIWARVTRMRIDKVSEQHLIPIGKLLNNADLDTRIHAARGLAAIGPEAKSQVDNLIAALDDTDSEMLYWTCLALKSMGEAAGRAATKLQQLKQHQDPAVRAAVAEALDKIQEKKVQVP
jgi:HEAT repeat protein